MGDVISLSAERLRRARVQQRQIFMLDAGLFRRAQPAPVDPVALAVWACGLAITGVFWSVAIPQLAALAHMLRAPS